MRSMRLVYLAHPLGAPSREGITLNIARAKRWMRWVIDNFDVSVVADWILYCELLDDMNPEHRARGMSMNREQLARCDELWLVGGRVSSGMADERDMAVEFGLRVADLTYLGETPPEIIPVELSKLLAVPVQAAEAARLRVWT